MWLNLDLGSVDLQMKIKSWSTSLLSLGEGSIMFSSTILISSLRILVHVGTGAGKAETRGKLARVERRG